MEEKIEKIDILTSELKIVSYKEYFKALHNIKQYQLQEENKKLRKKNHKLKHGGLGCRTRLWNGIEYYFRCELNINLNSNEKLPIGELSIISIRWFRRCVGIKTTQELKDLCFNAGVILQP